METADINYLEGKIKKTIKAVEHEYYQTIMDESYDDEWPGWTNEWIIRRITDLYYYIAAYLELKKAPILLNSFHERFKLRIETKIDLLKIVQIHPEYDSELEIITAYKQYLESFKAFDYHTPVVEEQNKLISILRNSGYIIQNVGKPIKNEADIYKTVKWILGLYYPSVRSLNKASHIGQFKCYNPDILIPEINSAIEYKYINDLSDNIDSFIDQVHTDAVNYVGDIRYQMFYAVIYIEDISIATPESISISWEQKKFPKNWQLILTGDGIKI